MTGPGMSNKRSAGRGTSGNSRFPPNRQNSAPTPPTNTSAIQQGLTTMDALSYLREVKEHFKHNKTVYDIFLDIMKEFKARQIDTADVIRRVKELFKGHDSLILGFNTFVPKGYEIKIGDLQNERLTAERAAAKAGQTAEQSKKPSSLGSAQQQQQPEDQSEQGDANKGKRPVEYDQAFNYVNKIRTRFRDEERVYNAFLEILNMYRKSQKTISQVHAEVATLFKDHSDLLEEFECFLPDTSAQGAAGPLASQDPEDPLRRQINKRKSARRADEPIRRQPANLTKELQFFERVKNRLRNREAYQDLLKCLNIYNQEIISKYELQVMVYDILNRTPDLIPGFNEFLARCETMDIDLMDSSRGRDGKPSFKELQKVKQAMTTREKFVTLPVSELDLSMCERCGPSYRQLPKTFPRFVCSDRTELCYQVLNDLWVNVTSGSEDYSFKQMRKNQYEESLFRCEDDRFELDMIIETNESTIKALQPIMDKLEEMSAEEKAGFLFSDDALSSVQMRCVERIYAEHGHEIRDLMFKNPSVTIPVVLMRLRQKDEDWRKCREEMNKVWAQVYEKNYHKSLDHRSFYFKQSDKKHTSTKGMLAEIREVSEKRRREEESLMVVGGVRRGGDSGSAAAGTGRAADLRFHCDNAAVHNHVYKILNFSLAEYVQSSEQGAKLLNFYRKFQEPFFGLPEREDDGLSGKQDWESSEEKEEREDTKPPKKERQSEGDKPKPSSSPANAMEDSNAAAESSKADSKDESGSGGNKENECEEELDDEADDDNGEDAELAIDDNQMEEDEEMDKEFKSEVDAEDAEEEEEEEEEDQEDDNDEETAKEAADKQLYTGCKPVASVPESEGGLAVPVPTGCNAGPPPHIFYANEALYLFFRYHQHLYERVAISHKEAAQAQAKRDAGGGASGGPSSSSRSDSAHHADPNVPPASVLDSFFTLLFHLLEGTMEPSKYEDECRSLLGNNAYMLFTLDKLLLKLMKQLQALQNDEVAVKLLKLYEYEKSRGVAFRDDVYHANAVVLLNDETCYRMEFSEDGHLSMTMTDNSSDKPEIALAAMDYTFSDYLNTFLLSKSNLTDKRGVLLMRNLKGGGEAPENPDSIIVYNGLECKISCNTSKVSYVLDTEDLFHRRGRGIRAAGEKNNERTTKETIAAARFHQLLEKHAATTPAIVEPELE